ncbi:MAG: hypothetical protein JSS01_00945 [Proteobacteria bacterium]|nr:hypothetical protein [Pseudomonadota bacterium]
MPPIQIAAASAAILSAGLFAHSAGAACYVVYGADKQVIYRSQTPPVDLSRPLHETLPQVAPGGTLVFSLDSNGCELEINQLPSVGGARASAVSAPASAPAAARR